MRKKKSQKPTSKNKNQAALEKLLFSQSETCPIIGTITKEQDAQVHKSEEPANRQKAMEEEDDDKEDAEAKLRDWIEREWEACHTLEDMENLKEKYTVLLEKIKKRMEELKSVG